MQHDLTGLPDSELEARAARGDRLAFAELYERYATRVYDFLLRLTHDGEEAADLMQETFVRAMKGPPARASGRRCVLHLAFHDRPQPGAEPHGAA